MMQHAKLVNPHVPHSISPLALIASIYRNRQLVVQMTRREVVGKYRGSVLGLAWSFVLPIFMLVVYTFVFSIVFKARWSVGESGSKSLFSLALFVGMIMHGFFSEVLNRAPGLMVSNVSFIKKVVFPIEILPVVSIAAALFHCCVSLLVLLVAFAIFKGSLYWTVLWTPLILLPFVLLTLGSAWILASLGVFLRDVGQVIGVLTTVLMFLAPVFYPITAVPEPFRTLLFLNPLTFVIEQVRAVSIFGVVPDFSGLVIYTGVAVVVLWLGFTSFQKTRQGFADVL